MHSLGALSKSVAHISKSVTGHWHKFSSIVYDLQESSLRLGEVQAVLKLTDTRTKSEKVGVSGYAWWEKYPPSIHPVINHSTIRN